MTDWWKADEVETPLTDQAWWQEDEPAERNLSAGELLAYGPAGVNVGLANTLGAPVDVANFLIGRFRGALDPEHIPGQTPRTLSAAEPIGGSAQLRRLLTEARAGYESIEDVPRSARPLARGGEVFGESIPFAAAPLAAARAGAKGGRFTGPVLEAARTAPGSFAVTEAAGALGAGMGGAAAEFIAPGNRLAGFAGEVAGGVASPVAVLNRGLRGASDALQRISSSVSPAGREAVASRRLAESISLAGEEPAALLPSLRAPGDVPGVDLTPAQKTGSTALIGLERKLARDIPDLDNRLQSRLRRTTEALNRAYADAVQGGDSGLVRSIAQERARWFSNLIEARVTAAEQRAFEETAGLRPTVGRGEAGITARQILEDALTDARTAERALWADVPRDQPVLTEGLLEAYDGAREALLAEEGLPAPVEAFVARVRQDPEAITSGELLRFRSRVLAMQRNIRSSASPDWTVHRALGELAEGALDDLGGIAGTDDARRFSYQLNNLFSRGEVGRLLGSGPSGGVRVPPEMTLERSIGTGGTRGAVASRQIEDAAQLQGLSGRTQMGPHPSTLPAQEQFLRNLITRTMDEKGRISGRQLETFRRENMDLIRWFPELNASLGSAAEAQDFLMKTRTMQKRAQKAVQQRAAFSRIAGIEDPARGVGAVLSGANPIRDYRQVARMTATGGQDALAGLRQATFDHLFSQATTTQGLVSGRRMREMLTRKTTRGAPSLLDTMIQHRIITPEQQRNLMQVMDTAERVEDVLESGARIGDVLGDVNALEDLLTRVIGANIGGAGAVGQFTGAPLVAAQAGSQFARRLTQQIPLARTQEIIAQAIEDPKLMAALLEKGRAPLKRRDAARQINAWLLQTAVPGLDQGNEQ